MKRIAILILLFLVSAGSMDALAARTKSKTFTKRYRNEKLIVVLQDLCNRNGYTLKILDEIDENKRITANFKKASTSNVLRKVLDKEYQGKAKKGVLTISRKPSPPNVYTVKAGTPYEVIDNDSMRQEKYMDTVYTVNCMLKTIEKPRDSISFRLPKKIIIDTTGTGRREHNVQFLLGGGYSSMGYSLGKDGKEIGFVGGNAQFRYLYYFKPNWGAGLGIGFSNYGSTGTLNTTTVFQPHVFDSDVPVSGTHGEDYEHHVRTNDWQEKQRTYMIDIPAMVQCTYPLSGVSMKHGPVKVYADMGVNIGLSLISASRQLTGGSIDHIGWYAPWKLELTDIAGHDFYSESAADFGTDKKPLGIRLVAVGVMADVGLAIPVAKHFDLMVGVYANCAANDICANKQDIGWKQPDATGYQAHDFMNEYAGLIGTQYARSAHPWQVGVRVGFNFNTKTPIKIYIPEADFERINVCDTTRALEERIETTLKEPAQQIKRTLEKSIIWFDLNSTEPKLEPADILIQVASILKENPKQRILVTGHASKDGSRSKNQRLSEERAKIIVKMLVELGVSPKQVESRGEGVGRDYMQGEHDIRLDRRVEITVIE